MVISTITIVIVVSLFCCSLCRAVARPMPKQVRKEQNHDHPYPETNPHGATISDPAPDPPAVHHHHNSAGVVQIPVAPPCHEQSVGTRTINPIAEYAFAALDRAMGANAAGEIKGLGPAWACENYAAPDHNYYDCNACKDNFVVRNSPEAA